MSRIHYSKTPFNYNSSKKYKNNNYLKPDGLWYSLGDSWKKWVHENLNSDRVKYETEIIFHNKNILKIYPNDVPEFYFKYGFKYKKFKLINWKQVKKDYDGIEFPNYSDDHIFQKIYTFYNIIDIPCGCIWAPLNL